MKLAYYVPDEIDEDGADIKFLDDQQAVEWQEQLELPDPLERREQYDEFAALGYVPPTRLLEDGWLLPCWECEKHCYGEDDGVVTRKRATWCSLNCQIRYDEKKAQILCFKACMERWIKGKFPFVEIENAWNGGPGTCRECFNNNRMNVACRFVFPGSKINNNSACYGCKRIWICNGDKDAWEQSRGEATTK